MGHHFKRQYFTVGIITELVKMNNVYRNFSTYVLYHTYHKNHLQRV